ncbi:MAG TPA: FAD-dependent oxidoreductase [Puia sp.]|nr:FAD-dependent oxidoreductase [Puia sp.]
MQKIFQLKILPSESENASVIKQHAAIACGHPVSEITGFMITKRSIDSRAKQIWIVLTLQLFINEPFEDRKSVVVNFQDVTQKRKTVIIIGAGPAGLFAALKLIELGIKPIILERGKDVRARRRDLAILNKTGIINEESNYCFGEGGAGTYSDGKLYTRSSKRGNVDRILNLFVQFGAEKNILSDAHPHIGTNKLPHIITAIRKQIVDCGGIFLFETKVVDFVIGHDKIQAVKTSGGNSFTADAIIAATGHSAREIFNLLHEKKILIEAKPFALGVRIEHPQKLIDSIQYHNAVRNEHLPPASYSLVDQINKRGVFSFCMCPGGIIAPASTKNNELVVNGWSPSKRNNPFANSGIVVGVDEKDALCYFKKNNTAYLKENSLLLMHFQHAVEQKSYDAGGGKFVAPAQRMTDFVSNIMSSSLPGCSYLPGIKSASLREVLPDFTYECLQKAFVTFGKKMKGYFTHEAVVVATESRTSSPVRIPRDNLQLYHPQIKNFYPCGEGAGYAGGIMSAAMDGEKVAEQIARILC